MELTIFDTKDYNSAKEFQGAVNAFQKSHIVYKFSTLENGTVYIWGKSPKEVGNTPMETIEMVDRITKKDEEEYFATHLDLEINEVVLAELKTKLKGMSNDDADFVKVTNEIRAVENQIKMHKETLERKERQIKHFKETVLSLSKEL